MNKIRACVITCLDFRFQEGIRAYLEKNGYLGEVDIISVAGSSHDIATPETPENYNYIMEQIAVSVALHHPQKIIIIEHQDCGMYAATGKINSGLELTEDTTKHCMYLRKVKVIINKEFPELDVVMLMAGLDGSFTEIGKDLNC